MREKSNDSFFLLSFSLTIQKEKYLRSYLFHPDIVLFFGKIALILINNIVILLLKHLILMNGIVFDT